MKMVLRKTKTGECLEPFRHWTWVRDQAWDSRSVADGVEEVGRKPVRG